MSSSPLPIIYITGATATGKGTLGKHLAYQFGLYHISLGDLRRAHLASIRAGLPSMDSTIRELVTDDKEIPKDLLDRYETVPAVLHYYNYRAAGHRRSWTLEVAQQMVDEEIARVNALAQSEEGKHIKGILIDGHPLTRGVISQRLVEKYLEVYAGITIVLESPREVAKQRYIERGRPAGDLVKLFEVRMEKTDVVLPRFLELMAEHGDVIVSTNDANMSIEDAYNALLSKLEESNAWNTFVNRK